MRSFSSWWSEFTYNYGWSARVAYIDGWIPKFSLFVPLIGYMILFNDEIANIIEFRRLTQEMHHSLSLSTASRLHFIYYGLFLLGVSNFIYKAKRPYIFRFGTDFIGYSRTALEHFTFSDFLNIHESIRHDGHQSVDGKYYDSEWDAFASMAREDSSGTSQSWEDAKSHYGSLLRSMLRENFIKKDKDKRVWLTCCVIMSTLGYLFLAVPSIDLFVRVTISVTGL